MKQKNIKNIIENRRNNSVYKSEKEIMEFVEDRKSELELLIKKIENVKRLKKDAFIKVMERKNHVEYYWRKKSSSKWEFLSKDKWDVARKIAQNDYDRKILRIAEKEHRIVTKYLNLLKKEEFLKLNTKLARPRKMLINMYRENDEEYIQQWMSEQFKPMEFENDSTEYFSGGGTRVRSKSELIIANMLEKYSIPYKYEYPVNLNKFKNVRPDFICLNVITRKEYIWEHFGMMDNIAYANNNIAKLNAYEENGYFLGDNLIMTFETSQCPINSNVIKSNIEKYLL